MKLAGLKLRYDDDKEEQFWSGNRTAYNAILTAAPRRGHMESCIAST